MADGLNDARAIRIAEIVSDFRNLQYYIAQIKAAASAEDYYLEGYTLLRQCAAEAQTVLDSPYQTTAPAPQGNMERQKSQLRSVITDAAVRRFRCQRAYLRAHAAMRWMNSRNSLLQGQKPHASHFHSLQAIDHTLRAELAAISDEHVLNTLTSADAAEGKWLDEDPSLTTIQNGVSTRS